MIYHDIMVASNLYSLNFRNLFGDHLVFLTGISVDFSEVLAVFKSWTIAHGRCDGDDEWKTVVFLRRMDITIKYDHHGYWITDKNGNR